MTHFRQTIRRLGLGVLTVTALSLLVIEPVNGSANHGPHSRANHHNPKPIIVLDPGHGGWDTGGVHKNAAGTVDYMEKTITLDLGFRIRHQLRRHGYEVFMTRTRDTAVNVPPKDVNHDGVVNGLDDLEARVRFSNRHHASVFVSIHINAASSPSAKGLAVYYCPAHLFKAENIALARDLDRSVLRRLRGSGYRAANRGILTDVSDPLPQAYPEYPWFFQIGPRDRKHGIVANKAVSALGETLFITNPREDTLLHRAATLRAIAVGYSKGIEHFLAAPT